MMMMIPTQHKKENTGRQWKGLPQLPTQYFLYSTLPDLTNNLSSIMSKLQFEILFEIKAYLSTYLVTFTYNINIWSTV